MPKSIILLLLIAISGCSFKQGDLFNENQFKANDNKASVLIYRIKQLTGSAVLTPVYINGKKQDFSLSCGSFATVNLDPGEYVFHTKARDWMTPIAKRTKISVEAGKEYLMRFKTKIYVVEMVDTFELVPKDIAVNELKNMRKSLEK